MSCVCVCVRVFLFYEDDKERDVWVDLKKIGTMHSVRGSIHLKFKWSGRVGGATSHGDGETDALLGSDAAAMSSDFMSSTGNEDPEFSAQSPNELRIIVVQARNLLAMDTGMFGSQKSDPYVKIKLAGCKTKKTKYLKETLDPVWNEAFTLEQVTDKTRSFEVICYDWDRMRYVNYMICIYIHHIKSRLMSRIIHIFMN